MPAPPTKICLAISTLAVSARVALGQAGFQNLNFEGATIPPGTSPATTIPANVGIPGWSTANDVVYDGVSTGGAIVSVNDSNTPLIHFTPLQGSLSVILWAGPPVPSTSISQTGVVPANSLSIQMDIEFLNGLAAPSQPFAVTLGGHAINMIPLYNEQNYTVYGGNVAAFAGQSETLTITEYAPAPPNVPPSALALDDIIFSPGAVPEPSTWALLVLGAGALWFLRRKS